MEETTMLTLKTLTIKMKKKKLRNLEVLQVTEKSNMIKLPMKEKRLKKEP
jgi:hypothetical protein